MKQSSVGSRVLCLPPAAPAAAQGWYTVWANIGQGGSQYRSRAFQAEIKWLGIRSTPAYVGEPECNGVVERLVRTLKEECPYLNDLETFEEVREVIGAFVERYNRGWLLQRNGYLTPARAREKLSRRAA